MMEAKEHTYTILNEPITGYKICVKKSFFDRATNTKNIHKSLDPTPMDLLLVKVIIPEGATVYTGSEFSKCRSNRAFVDSIYAIDTDGRSAYKSIRDHNYLCYAKQAYKGYAYSIYFTSLVCIQARFSPSWKAHRKKDCINFLENTRDIQSHYKKGDTILIKNYFNKTPIELLNEREKPDDEIRTPETEYLSFLKAVSRCECASGFHFYKTEEEALISAVTLLRTGGF